ncbi:MAG: NAD(P)/FAD-dependent oxidoreductase [Bacteroidales bacterium]|nr:NAD(P)/FAD-dependent oxidoreductase [Bacteroidales bacterium]MDD6622418.1 NAD(P)/FAD-dependent oxidoreductase [Bacteroidales bacterium]MDD6670104.1 NAD(P)/FAD-dependent oxidoreductase [Bacteroidales bacterium]
MEKVVIIGGGFAGINVAKRLDKRKYHVTIIDKNNYHSFPPLFYQIASSGIEPGSISFPFRREMRKLKNADFHFGKVKAIDTDSQIVTTEFEQIRYDKLIVATGTTNNFFNNPELCTKVHTLKSTAEAIRLRNEILDRLERACITADPERRRQLLSFVVVGGGPTGVEIAGALGEMKRYILKKEYPEIDRSEVRVILIEGTDRFLRTMSERASADAAKYLDHLMIETRLNCLMESYEDNILHLSNGEDIYCETLIWTAGVTGNIIDGLPTDAIARGNRLIVGPDFTVKGTSNVYAIGDIAMLCDDSHPNGYPQVAQVAIQQAKYLTAALNGKSNGKPFCYVDKGSMATIGRNRAVCDLNFAYLYGRPAWLTWMFIHLISILGMRNKANVLMNWIWAYIFYTNSLRLLIRPTKYPIRKHWTDE